MSPDGPLSSLSAILVQEGGLLAATLREGPAARDAALEPAAPTSGPGLIGSPAGPGPRTLGREAEYALVLETIREGYLLHYGNPRLLDDRDPDLALLAGDRLYALGLSRLVELGDVDAVTVLADLISLCATAHAVGDLELAQAAWESARVTLGWGSDEGLDRASVAARRAVPGQAGELWGAADRRARGAGGR